MLVMVSASMWMPLASRSPRAASETACWNRSRSVISSSIVRAPARARDPEGLVRARAPRALRREEREEDEYAKRCKNELRTGECLFKPLLSLRARRRGLWRRKGPARHRHAVDTEDLDLPASGDRRLRRRRECLNRSVVGERDGAVPPLADAHGDPRLSADKVPQRGRPLAFG